jgi:hypothetical protein
VTEANKCPICGGEVTTYKSKPVGELMRRLRRCKNRKGCGYKEIIIVRITERILERRPAG